MARAFGLAKLFLTACLGAFLSLGWASVADSLVRSLPRVTYSLQMLSARSACEQVRPGMAKSAALRLLSRAADPSSEEYKGGATGDFRGARYLHR